MTGGDMISSRLTVPLLIIEEHISVKSLQKLTLVQAAQEQRLIDSDVPGSQGTHYPFMGRCGTRCHQASANGCFADRKCTLDLLQTG